jgi:ankyrin repeat protein
MNFNLKRAFLLSLVTIFFLHNQSCNTYYGPLNKLSSARKSLVRLSIHYFHRHPVLGSTFIACSIATGAILGKKLYDCLQSPIIEHCHEKSCDKEESNKVDLTLSLMKAIKAGNIEEVLELIALGVDVDKPYVFEEATLPPLVVAILKGENDIARCLVEHGADVNAEYNFAGIRAVPLFAAVWQNNIEIIQYLIEHMANVNAVRRFNRSDNATILHDAILIGNMSMIRYLVEQGANVNAISIYFGNPCSVLCTAIMRGNIDIVCYLIEHGADVNTTCDKPSPLELAITLNDIAVVKCLVEHGAHTNLPNNSECYALDIARNKEIRTYLRSKGAKSKEEENDEAAYYGPEGSIDKQTRLNYSLNKAIHNAVKSGDLTNVNHLIAAGADINAKCIVDNYEETPLDLAIIYNDVTLAQYLIEHGANVNALTSFGWPCLHDAIILGHLEVLKTLVQAGADINLPNSCGLLALDKAEKKEMREYLISKGAKSKYAN